MTELTYAERAEQKAAVARAAYIRGLVELADLLDAHPEIPLPYQGRISTSSPLHVANGDAATITDLLGRPVHAEVRDSGRLWLTWHIAGLSVTCSAGMCEREITGVRVIGDREVPVTEYAIPEHFQPAPTESAVSV